MIPRAMLHNPAVYPDPDRFWPERYEGLNESRLDAIDPRNIVFGFGRRYVLSVVRETTESLIECQI